MMIDLLNYLINGSPQWYNAQQRRLLVATGTALWHHAGIAPVPIRWVLVRDPSGAHGPAAFLSTDLDAQPATILRWFVSRWRVETTFQQVRAHLGVETQRQWSDLAILRTTPGTPGVVLADHRVGRCAGARHRDRAAPERRGVVQRVGADVQRRHRRGSPRTLGTTKFLHLPATGRDRRNCRQLAQSHPPNALPRRQNCGKSR